MTKQAPSTLPEGTLRFEFGGIELHEVTTDLSDNRPVRFAVHEFDRRDGAESEWMARGPMVTRATLAFVGKEGIETARKLAALLDAEPTRLLVHPVWGSYQATCHGFNGATLAAATPNLYRVPVEFTEATLDSRALSEVQQGVPSKAQAVTGRATELTDALDAAELEVAAATTAATEAVAFAEAVLASAQGGSATDATLARQLGALVTQTAAAQAALYAVGTPEAAAIAVTAEILLAEARELGAAVLALRPAPSDYVVASDTPLLALAGRLYGRDARDRLDELLSDNPSLVGLVVIPTGMRLRVAA